MGLLVACAPDKPKEDLSNQNAPGETNAVAENTDLTKGIGQVTAVTLNTKKEEKRNGRG